MPLYLQTNTASLGAQKSLNASQTKLAGSIARLSSGFRINSAADDAAGLAVSESMKSKIRSYTVAERNAADGTSMVQTAESSLGEVHGVLGRMRELSMQAANGSLSDTERGYLDTEFTALKDEITRMQGSAKFNGTDLISSSASSVSFQVGLNNAANDKISVTFGGLDLSTLVGAGTKVGTASDALSSLATIDAAISTVSDKRATFGAAMARLDVASSNIGTMKTNLAAANSRIVDVDVAAESAMLSRNQVLTQAGISVLAQANQLPQLAASLLR